MLGDGALKERNRRAMLSREELKSIGAASTEEERKLLCDLYGVSLEWFNAIWPAEKLGEDVLDGKAALVKVEHQFEPTESCFDSHAHRPRYRHTLVVQFKSYEPGHLAVQPGSWRTLTPYAAVGQIQTICVDEELVPPSLQEAIEYCIKPRW